MKNWRYIILLLFCNSQWLHAQIKDSLIIKQVDSLVNASMILINNQEFDEALNINNQAAKLAIKHFGKISTAYASTCTNHGYLLAWQGEYHKAEPLLLDAKQINEKLLGTNHPIYASSLNVLAELYIDLGEYEKAEKNVLEATEIIMHVLGIEDPEYLICLYILGDLYYKMGNYNKAELILLKNKTLIEKVLGKEDPLYTLIISGLGNMYCDMGKYNKAEPFYLEAKTIREKVVGKEHAEYGSSLDNLAQMYGDLGKYGKAEPLYLEALAITEKVMGKQNLEYALGIDNLGVLYLEIGNTMKSELCFIEAKTIREKVLGKLHPHYSISLDHLATLYSAIGIYSKAEILNAESKELTEKILGKDHPYYAIDIKKHADLYFRMGKNIEAEMLYLESAEIIKKSLGKENSRYIAILIDLGSVNCALGKFQLAESYCLEAKEIIEKVLGKEHTMYMQVLSSFGLLYKSMGNLEKAESLLVEAAAISSKVLGKEHNNSRDCLFNLANLYQAKGDFKKAELLFIEVAALNQSLITKAYYHLSEQELNKYILTFESVQDSIFSFSQQLRDNSNMSKICFDMTLFSKGFLLNSAQQGKLLILGDPITAEKYDELKSIQRQLSIEYTKPIAERQNVSDLEEKSNFIEKDLARSILCFADTKKQVNWSEVQQNLKQDEVAIEFVQYRYGSMPTDSVVYVALLLKSGELHPKFIPLCSEKQLLTLLSIKKQFESISQLYTSRGATPIKDVSLQGLYDLIWKPLDSMLEGVETIYYSPSGLFHRINFDAIPDNTTTTLSNRYKLVRLGSTRSLVVPNVTKVDTSNKVILFGGINYNLDTTFQILDTFSQEDFVSTDDEVSFTYVNRGLKIRGGDWVYLPGTETEIQEISKIFEKSNYNRTTFSSKYATEESFKNMGKTELSPRVLHIATHGFFFPDPKESHQSSAGSRQEEPEFKISDHPMIRSGLILAGGNYAWKEGKPFKEGKEDGILTAYEISQMNLSNTELVVLSACETGLGDIQGNEGVYGLQRAFKIAGAKYLMMSLWQVPDEETKEFMIRFYKNWLEEKLSIPEAFRITQKEMREKYTDPYLWAGFVLVE